MRVSKATIDRIQGDKALVVVKDETNRQIIMDKEKLPKIARHQDADLEIKFEEGEITDFRYVRPEEKD